MSETLVTKKKPNSRRAMAAVHSAWLVYLEFRLLWADSKSKSNSAATANALVARHPNLKKALAWSEVESAKKHAYR